MTESELKAALKIKTKINRLQDRLNDIHVTGGVGAVSNSERVSGGETQGIAQQAVDIECEIAELTKEFEIEKEIVRRTIEKVGLEELQERILVMRYVDCLLWKHIEGRIGYGHSRTMEFHQEALNIGLHRTLSD